MMTIDSYPKIEIYSEVDMGDPHAGSKKWSFADGKTVYGGAVDHRPFIKCTTITLNDQQKDELLSTPLTFLPYFKEQKPAITLAHYFAMSRNADRSEFKKLLPLNLDALYNQKEEDHYRYFNTLVLNKKTWPHQVTVVWLNEKEYYVNEVYYTALDLDSFIKEDEQHEAVLMEGALRDFLKLSPWFQRKLSEGFSDLIPQVESPVIPENDLIFSYQLTPGMLNNQSYFYELWSGGQLKSGDKTIAIDVNRVSELLLRSLHLDWKLYDKQSNGTAKPFVHDKQIIILTIWHEGHRYRLVDPYLESSGSPLVNFRDFALTLIRERLNSEG